MLGPDEPPPELLLPLPAFRGELRASRHALSALLHGLTSQTAIIGEVRIDAKMQLAGRLRCKRIGIEPFAYLRDVLDRISTHPAAGIRELTPRGWKESLERHTAAAAMTAG